MIGTKYNLLNVLTLIENENDNCVNDIFIYSFSGLKNYINKLEEIDKINNVFYIECGNKYVRNKNNKLLTYSFLAYDIIFNDNLKKQLPNKSYDELLIPSDNVAYQITYDIFYKNKKDMKLTFYEDGLFTYFNIFRKRNFIANILFELKFGYYYIDHIDDILVHNKEFVNYPNEKDINIKEFKIKKIDYLDKIFNLNTHSEKIKKFKDSQLIVLDQNFSGLVNTNSILKILNSISEKKNYKTIIKLHPSKNKNSYNYKNIKVTNCSLPFELIVGHLDNIDQKVLISVYSTACLTPKLIYNKEPYVILLFKLFKNKIPHINNEYFNFFKKKYDNKDKFLIPESLNEFKDIISNLKFFY